MLPLTPLNDGIGLKSLQGKSVMANPGDCAAAYYTGMF